MKNMSKKAFFSFALASILAFSFTSCLKDGDLEALKHPIHLQGTFNPNLGVPLGSAQISIGDLISMFKQTNGFIEIDADSVVTIAFDTCFDTHTDVGNKVMRKNGRKDAGDTVCILSEVYEGAIDIDIFDNINGIPSDEDFQVSGLFATLQSRVKANATPQTASLMASHNVTANIDSVHIQFMDKSNVWHEISIADSNYTVAADQLTSPTSNGCLINLLDNTNLSSIINSRPKKMSYALRLTFTCPSTEMFSVDPTEFMMDSLQIRSLDLHSTIGVRLPLSIYLRELSYGVDLAIDLNALADQLDKYDASLEESHLYLELENGLPLGFNIQAEMQDAANNTLCHITGTSTAIGGAQTTLNPGTGTYFATKATSGLIDIVLDQQTVSAFRSAHHIHINSSVFTSDNTNPAKPCVSIRQGDILAARAYLQVHPTLTIDIPILNK